MKDSKKKLLQRMEEQDALGISRKKHRFKLSLAFFNRIKIFLILLIPVFYFVYSPLLIYIMIAYTSLFFLCFGVEKHINKSFLKKNRIKIPRLDSALALIIIVIAVAGIAMGGTVKTRQGAFSGMSSATVQRFSGSNDFSGAKRYVRQSAAKRYYINFASLLTGERSIFTSTQSFGTGSPPENFRIPGITENGEMPEMPEGGFPVREGSENRFERFNREDMVITADSLPLAYTFASLLASVNTVIIFLVPAVGIAGMFLVRRRKRKMEEQNFDVIEVSDSLIYSAEALDKILSFGEELEECVLSE